MNPEQVTHQFNPVIHPDSRILILGTFPSVKSRENQFYYGHPQNRFWKVLASIFGGEVPQTIEEKKEFLQNNQIAIWDVIATCMITGSSDSSISDVIVNDISWLLTQAPIETIYGNGLKACELYQKYVYPLTKREIVKLPSTSPANASFQLERLIQEWSVINKERKKK